MLSLLPRPVVDDIQHMAAQLVYADVIQEYREESELLAKVRLKSMSLLRYVDDVLWSYNERIVHDIEISEHVLIQPMFVVATYLGGQ